MKHYFNCYHYFLSGTLTKEILYVLYPFVTLCFSIPICSIGRGLTEVSLLIISWIILSVELLIDFLCFGGLLAKETDKFTFLHTSAKGISLLKKALRTDLFRKALCATFLLLVGSCVKLTWADLWKVIITILVTLLSLELCQFVTRQISSTTLYMLFFSVAFWIYFVISQFFMELLDFNPFLKIPCCVLLAIIYLCVHFLGEKWILTKARKSLYDETV